MRTFSLESKQTVEQGALHRGPGPWDALGCKAAILALALALVLLLLLLLFLLRQGFSVSFWLS